MNQRAGRNAGALALALAAVALLCAPEAAGVSPADEAALLCGVFCAATADAAAAAAALSRGADPYELYAGTRDACDCTVPPPAGEENAPETLGALPPAPEADMERDYGGAAWPPLADDALEPPAELEPAPSAEIAVAPSAEIQPAPAAEPAPLPPRSLSTLCADELQSWLEWTEDGRRAEISSTTITLYDVTDHIHYTPMCHSLCTDICGGLPLGGLASSPSAPDVLMGDCFTVTPAQFFENLARLLANGTELLVNLSGFGDGTDVSTDVSVGVLITRPVYDALTAALRFDYRLAAAAEADVGRRRLLQLVVSREELVVLDRVHVTGTLPGVVQRDLVQRNLVGTGAPGRVERGDAGAGVAVVSRGDGIASAGDRFGLVVALTQALAFLHNFWSSTASEEDCLWKAIKQFGTKVAANRGLVVGEWSWVPPGCSVQSGGDWAAHYNRGRGDDDASNYTPVSRDVAVTQEDCLWEAVKVFGNKVIQHSNSRKNFMVGSWDHMPYGCSVRSGGDWAVHWNNRVGQNNGDYTSVKPSDASYGPPFHEAFWDGYWTCTSGESTDYCGVGWVVDEKDCLWKAIKMYGNRVAERSGLIVGSWTDVPRGCSVERGRDWAVLWNNQRTAKGTRFWWWLYQDADVWDNYLRVRNQPVGNAHQCLWESVRAHGSIVRSKRGLVEGSWFNVPHGCSVQIGGDMSAHWNTHDGKKRGRTFENTDHEWFLPYETVKQKTRIAMAGARMSSVYRSFAPGNCLVDSASSPGSMCHSAKESDPFWEADTADGMTYQIEFVVVRNRVDCCRDRFRKYVVTVDGVECARGDAGGKPDFLWIPCSARGSTVRLQLLGNDYLNLQYVGVEGKDPKPKPSPPPAPTGEKVAMAGARMSSELPGGFPAANCLVDSDAFGSMCHTDKEETPWWEASTADGGAYDITKVIVRNRADCLGLCTDRFQNYQLLIKAASNDLPEWKVCAEGDANGKQGYYEIDCTNAACCRGKMVRLQLLTRGGTYLNFQYVGVEGTLAP